MRNINSRRLNAGLVALAAFSSVLVTGCSSEGIVDAPEGAPFSIKASIGDYMPQSKAPTLDLHETAFVKNDKIRVFVWDASNSWTRLLKDDYTFSGTAWSSSTAHTIPTTCEQGEVIGIYPTFDTWETIDITDVSASEYGSFTFTIDAFTDNDTDYNKSDLMIAYTQISYGSPAATLKFRHALSKIIFNLSCSASLGDIKESVMEMQNVTRQVKVSSLIGGNYMVSPLGTQNNKQEVKKASDKVDKVAIVMAPQTPTADTHIEITLGQNTYKAYFPAGTVFNQGCKYTFNINIDASTMEDATFTLQAVSIVGWSDVEDPNGDMTIE